MLQPIPFQHNPQTDTTPRYTDLYNARRLVEKYGDKLRFVGGKWMYFNGVKWETDSTSRVYQAAQDTICKLYEEAAFIQNQSDRTELIDHARRSEATRNIKNMVEAATWQEEVACSLEAFDRENTAFLLNGQGQAIDLQTQQIRPSSADDLLTKAMQGTFEKVTDERMQASRWIRFIDEITKGDTDLAHYLQKAVGYSITGDTSEQSLFVCFGQGANGKSVFLEVIRTLLGDYAVTLPVEALMQKGSNAANDLARTRGVRMVVSSENERGLGFKQDLLRL